jgi:hypothetical protein
MDSSSSTGPQLDPIAHEPKLTSDTLMPVLPSIRYLIAASHASRSNQAWPIFDRFTPDFKRADASLPDLSPAFGGKERSAAVSTMGRKEN